MLRGFAGVLLVLPLVACGSKAAAQAAGATPRSVDRRIVLGRSEGNRPIVAWEVGDPAARRVQLIVGCIHGDETAGIRVAAALERVRPPAGTLRWIVPDLNPDGIAAGTRQDGRGVDLNRNFPWHWRRSGSPGSTFSAGPHAASERETQIAMRLIHRIQPNVSIWFHQHLDVVDESGGDLALIRRFARGVGLRTATLTHYPGGVVNWENATMPGTTAFVVELPAGSVTRGRVRDFTRELRILGA
jgi:protein MpaA